MKLQNLIKSLPVAALSLTLMASSACADDNGRDSHRKDRRHNRDSNGVNIGLVIPGITVDLYRSSGANDYY